MLLSILPNLSYRFLHFCERRELKAHSGWRMYPRSHTSKTGGVVVLGSQQPPALGFLPHRCHVLQQGAQAPRGHRQRGCGRETPIGCRVFAPRLEAEPVTKTCALVGNQPSDLSLYGMMMPNPMSLTGQVHRVIILRKLLYLTF